jgi:hypothetical protein
MMHADSTVRFESLRLLLIMIKQQSDHRKVFLIQNYDIIKNSLSILGSETNPRVCVVLLDLIAYSILKYTGEFNANDINSCL